MKQWQRILAVCAATAGLGFLVAATPALAAEPAKAALTGDAVCTRCHDEGDGNVLKLYQTKHGVRGDARTPGCQSCHGTSDGHLKAKKTLPDVVFGKNKSEARAQDTACLTCHKSDKRTHWDGSQHQNNDVTCSNCHSVHASTDKVRSKKTQAEVCFACHKDQRNDTRKISHHPIGEGKVACSDCHNPHGSAGPKLLAKNTVNETCFTCHAEKRGPFLWEHQPATENCASCHTAHGSNISPLLKSRAPFMCSQCHDGPHNSKAPYGPVAAGNQGGFVGTNPSENAAGRGCMNCHSMVHGSNHPAGALLHR